MYERCPACGQLLPPPDDPTAARVAKWEALCARRGFTIRAGRVAESVAAELLGMRRRAFAAMRKLGTGPAYFALSIDGSQYSYQLIELAAWEECQQIGDSWQD